MKKIKIGKIVGTHALKGELKIRGNQEFTSTCLKKDHLITIEHNNQSIELKIVTSRVHKTNHLVSFEGLQDINLVEKYIGSFVYTQEVEELLDEGEYLVSDLIGCQVIAKDEKIGQVIDVIDNGRHDVLVIERLGKRVMIPYVDAFIVQDDIEAKKIEVKLIAGLIDEN